MQTYQKAFWVFWIFFTAGKIGLYAQAPVFKAPADYNDCIVLEQAAVGKKIEDFNKVLAAEQLKEAKKIHAELLGQLDVSIAKIGALGDFKGNTAFKNAAFELFVYYKMVVETDYAAVIRLVEKEGVNDKTFGRINAIFTTIQRDEAVMYGQFDNAQKAFSEQFKMKLGENEFEKGRNSTEPVKP
jgi:hypothetical protein